MARFIPDITDGTVTHSSTDNQRAEVRTPHWLKAIYAVLIALVAVIALGTLPTIL